MRVNAMRAFPARQEGVILFIALIVLVAMTLAGIGMVRSVDTGTAAAGNLGFKQMSLNSGESGIQSGYEWLVANAAGGTLDNTDATNGYYSSRPAIEPDWSDAATWQGAAAVNGGAADSAGNVVEYIVHRMCTEPNTPYNGTNAGVSNQCATAIPTLAGSGGSMAVGSYAFSGSPEVFYRITARSVGPRNTTTYLQAMVGLSE